MPTTSAKVLDLFVGHDVDLDRLFAGVRKETLASIERLSRELTDLVYRIDPTEPTRLLYRQKRLAKLVKESVSTISQAYGEMRGASRKQLASLAKLEAGASRVLVNEAVGMELATVALSSEQIRALTSNVLIEGSTIKEAWKTAEASTAKRFASSMRTGMRNGETINQLAKRLRERAFVTTNKHHAITLARTGFQEVSQAARQDLFEANTDVLKAIQQISTLDGRTSPICQAYSGATWSLPGYNALDGSPPYNGGPPRHFNCRSSLVPVTKSWRELSSKPRLPGGSGTPSQSLENRFKAGLKKRGFTDKQIARQKMGQRASMDGQVAGDTTYEKWLKGKSAAQRRDILGPSKARLWEEGKLTNLRDLVDQSGRPLTIDELYTKLGASVSSPGGAAPDVARVAQQAGDARNARAAKAVADRKKAEAAGLRWDLSAQKPIIETAADRAAAQAAGLDIPPPTVRASRAKARPGTKRAASSSDWGDVTKAEGQWHDDAFGPDVPDKLRRVIGKTSSVPVKQGKSLQGSYYGRKRAGEKVHIRMGKSADSLHNNGTWRHEYGHHVDRDHMFAIKTEPGKNWAAPNGNLSERKAAAMMADRQTLLTAEQQGFGKNVYSRISELQTGGDDAVHAALRKMGLGLDDLPSGLSQAERASVTAGLESRNFTLVNSAGSGEGRLFFNDMIGNVTNNQMGGGHSVKYLNNGTRINQSGWHTEFSNLTDTHTTEAFANYWALSGAPASERKYWRTVMERFLPETTQGFDELIEAILAGA